MINLLIYYLIYNIGFIILTYACAFSLYKRVLKATNSKNIEKAYNLVNKKDNKTIISKVFMVLSLIPILGFIPLWYMPLTLYKKYDMTIEMINELDKQDLLASESKPEEEKGNL